jgi:hypothetical protein
MGWLAGGTIGDGEGWIGHGRGNPWVYFFIPVPVNTVPCMVKGMVLPWVPGGYPQLLAGFDTYSKNIYFKI